MGNLEVEYSSVDGGYAVEEAFDEESAENAPVSVAVPAYHSHLVYTRRRTC